ncbi:uncharacterized protein V1510DRAFT_408966 [Dipodascopsis tothii]|uniref:uncharacterized protein n=1 Tax=Dipodascopsis tothii TaxID=44089 RepID=UPI0034CD95E1
MLLKNPALAGGHGRDAYTPQLEYRRDTAEQAEAGVRQAYADVLLHEARCAETDASFRGTAFDAAVWWDVVAAHSALFEACDDFLFRCALGAPGLRALPGKYRLRPRLWRAVSGALDLLRPHLPAAYDLAVSLVYRAYAVLARQAEFLPDTLDSTLESLGDLAACRAAIEPATADRLVWNAVAAGWYTRCALRNPGAGRIYHNLGLLAPDALGQLFYYAKAIQARQPYARAHTALAAVLAGAGPPSVSKFHAAFLHAVAGGPSDDFFRLAAGRDASWAEDGVRLAVVSVGLLCGALDVDADVLVDADTSADVSAGLAGLDLDADADADESGSDGLDGPRLSPSPAPAAGPDGAAAADVDGAEASAELEPPPDAACLARSESVEPPPLPPRPVRPPPPALPFDILALALSTGAQAHYGYIFAWLIFLHHLAIHPDPLLDLTSLPWASLVRFLSGLTCLADTDAVFDAPEPPSGTSHAISLLMRARDLDLRGLRWSADFPFPYTPAPSYAGAPGPLPPADETDEADEILALDSVHKTECHAVLLERILWTAHRIAQSRLWFTYDSFQQKFVLL